MFFFRFINFLMTMTTVVLLVCRLGVRAELQQAGDTVAWHDVCVNFINIIFLI